MRFSRAAGVLFLAFCRLGHAEETCQGPSDDCVAVGHWNFGVSLGAGVRTNPLHNGRAIPLVVIPSVSYYGKRVFLDDLDLGVMLFEHQNLTFNLVGSPGYDRVFFYRSDLQNIFVNFSDSEVAAPGVPPETHAQPFPHRSRAFTYLAGPEATYHYGGLSAQLDVLHDVTGHDHGTEVRAAVKAPLWQRYGVLSGSLGLTWKSAAIVNYYYGAPGVYMGGSGVNPFAKLGYTVPLSGKWRFNALLHVERLSNSIADSPLVAHHFVETVFIGASYSW